MVEAPIKPHIQTLLAILLVLAIVPSKSIEIPMHYGPRCMIIQAEFEPIKLQIKTPTIPGQNPNQKFKVVLTDLITQEQDSQTLIEQNSRLAKDLQLVPQRLYNLCIYVTGSKTKFNEATEQFYVHYLADEDFDALIGNIQIPQELVGEDNLQIIYNSTEAVSRISQKIMKHQQRQRELEDSLAKSNIHKNERIISLTLIQCLVIVLSGVYQVFALRRFLIEKNLY